MSVTIHTPVSAGLTASEVDAWRDVPASVTVDLEPGAQIDPAIRALTQSNRPLTLLGPAFTVACLPPDFGSVVLALDEAKTSDVVVIAAAGHLDHAVIGEILGGHLRAKGCAGLVVDGVVRDIGALGHWQDFPVYARGVNPLGPTSANAGTIQAPVEIGGRLVEPGDLVIGDPDGLAVLTPAQARARLSDAQAKLALEREWIEGLATGKGARAVFGL